MDNFTFPSKKKSRRRFYSEKKKSFKSGIFTSGNCQLKNDEKDEEGRSSNQNIEKHLKQISLIRDEIQVSQFWVDLKDLLSSHVDPVTITSHFEEIVSYGIGSFSTNPIARYQFALLSLLAQHLDAKEKVYLYDPVLSETEKLIAEEFKINLIQENEECKRKVNKRTLFFMLHCGKTMYDNLLSVNWNRGIEKLVIIGNPFSSYIERIPSSTLKLESPHICDIIPYTAEYEVKNSFEHKDIFNDTCLMMFPPHLLATAAEGFWLRERRVCRDEEDVEIITKDKVEEFRT